MEGVSTAAVTSRGIGSGRAVCSSDPLCTCLQPQGPWQRWGIWTQFWFKSSFCSTHLCQCLCLSGNAFFAGKRYYMYVPFIDKAIIIWFASVRKKRKDFFHNKLTSSSIYLFKRFSWQYVKEGSFRKKRIRNVSPHLGLCLKLYLFDSDFLPRFQWKLFFPFKKQISFFEGNQTSSAFFSLSLFLFSYVHHLHYLIAFLSYSSFIYFFKTQVIYM